MLLELFKFLSTGPIFSLNLAGKHVVVLNTVKSATDLFG